MSTSRSFLQFATWCDRLNNAIRLDVADLVVEVVGDVTRDLAQGTPIDVGTARSNWVASVGRRTRQQDRAYRPYRSRWASPVGSGGSLGEQGNVSPVENAARGALRAYDGRQPVYIQNNLPYIQRLDDGYSPQNADFVSSAMQSGVRRAVTGFRFRALGAL